MSRCLSNFSFTKYDVKLQFKDVVFFIELRAFTKSCSKTKNDKGSVYFLVIKLCELRFFTVILRLRGSI